MKPLHNWVGGMVKRKKENGIIKNKTWQTSIVTVWNVDLKKH